VELNKISLLELKTLAHDKVISQQNDRISYRRADIHEWWSDNE